MGTYSLDELIRRWQSGELSTEQAIGQMLLIIKRLAEQTNQLECTLHKKQGSK